MSQSAHGFVELYRQGCIIGKGLKVIHYAAQLSDCLAVVLSLLFVVVSPVIHNGRNSMFGMDGSLFKQHLWRCGCAMLQSKACSPSNPTPLDRRNTLQDSPRHASFGSHSTISQCHVFVIRSDCHGYIIKDWIRLGIISMWMIGFRRVIVQDIVFAACCNLYFELYVGIVIVA